MTQKKLNLLRIFVAVLLTFVCLFPIIDNDYVNWDDTAYVIRNWMVKEISWDLSKEIIMTSQVVGTYHPLTIISLAIDYRIGNGDPLPFHITSLVLHLLSVVLVFWFMQMLTKRHEIAFICALLFGIHPFHVEPVAWISSRKDVLYCFFYIAALISYLYYTSRKQKWLGYSVTMLLFILALMSKGVAVVFPVILLLIDHLQGRENYMKLILEKIPFFLISIFFGLLAIQGQQDGTAMLDLNQYPFYQTVFLATYGFIWYLISFFVPFKMAAYHPFPFMSIHVLPWYFYASAVPTLAIIILSIVYGRKYKWYVFGFGFFLVGMILLLKILPYGRGMVAERYTYVPYIGLFYILGYAYVKIKDGDWQLPKLAKQGLFVIGVAWVLSMGVLSFIRSDVWQNGDVMWGDVAAKYPNDHFAFSCQGDYWYTKGDYIKAFQLIDKSIHMYPEFSDAYNNRGKIYRQWGKNELAFADYDKAIQLDDKNFGAYLNRAILYMNVYKDTVRALQDFNTSLEVNPTYSLGYINRGVFYESMGEFDKAEGDYSMAIHLEPNNSNHYKYRGLLRYYRGRKQDAMQDYNLALHYKPNYGNVYYLRARIYKDLGDLAKARADAQKAIAFGFSVPQEFLQELQ